MPVSCLHSQGGGWVVQAPARVCEVTTQGWVGGQDPQVFVNLGGIRQLVCDVCSVVFRAVALGEPAAKKYTRRRLVLLRSAAFQSITRQNPALPLQALIICYSLNL